MTLYEQLIYNWERGFYSVVKNREGYKIVSHRAPLDRLWVTATCDTLDLAKEQLGMSYTIGDNGLIDDFWQIVDTIHPSELMGNGFQVGDKVEIKNYMRARQIFGVIDCITDEGTFHLEGMVYENCYFKHEDLKPVLPSGSDNQTVKEILTVQGEEKKEVDQLGNKLKQPIELDDNLVENSVNVDFDSGKPTARVGFLNGKYISIGERDVESRSHICNCGFWDSEKKWGETVYTQQFGDRCVSMSVTNNYVICSKCGQKLRRVAISYLDD